MADENVVLVQLATRIPKDLHRKVKLVAVKQDVTVADIVAAALGMWLEKHAKKG